MSKSDGTIERPDELFWRAVYLAATNEDPPNLIKLLPPQFQSLIRKAAKEIQKELKQLSRPVATWMGTGPVGGQAFSEQLQALQHYQESLNLEVTLGEGETDMIQVVRKGEPSKAWTDKKLRSKRK